MIDASDSRHQLIALGVVTLVTILVLVLWNLSAALDKPSPTMCNNSRLLPGQFSLTLRGQLPGPPPLTVMEVGCSFSTFLPTLASLVNWHHLLNGIA